MMDEATYELLSRYLDGDLGPRAAQELEERLAFEPELAEELAEMQRLCGTVKTLAGGEEPPEELARLLEPLRRSSPPPPRRVRPPFRWLAAAAAVILGLTVSLELIQRNPAPPAVAQDRPAPRTRRGNEPFRLRPLPTPTGEERVGAVDHLLAAEDPEPELVVLEPEALDVIGPLPMPVGDIPAGPPTPGELQVPSAERGGRAVAIAETSSEGDSEALRFAPQPEMESRAGFEEDGRAKTAEDTVGMPVLRSEDDRRPMAAARARARLPGCVVKVTLDEDVVRELACKVAFPVAAGEYAVQLEISDGRIVAVHAPDRLQEAVAGSLRGVSVDSPSAVTDALIVVR